MDRPVEASRIGTDVAPDPSGPVNAANFAALGRRLVAVEGRKRHRRLSIRWFISQARGMSLVPVMTRRHGCVVDDVVMS